MRQIPSFYDYLPNSNLLSINIGDCTHDEIMKIISEQNGKASEIPIHVIKKSSRFISPILSVLYNKCINDGIFPNELKVGIVIVVHAGKVWNIQPKEVTVVKQLEQLKILLNKFLHKYPDQPPTRGYTASNTNSLIDWNLQSGGPQLARWPCKSLLPPIKV